MEGQDGFNNNPNKFARTSSGLSTNSKDEFDAAIATLAATTINVTINNDNVINADNNNNDLSEQQEVIESSPCIIRSQNQHMPITNVTRIMRKVLPPNVKIADNAKEFIQECVTEYISFITNEANDYCHHEQRKTVSAEDLILAMERLGFDNYVEPLICYLNRYRESESRSNSSPKQPITMHDHLDRRQPVYYIGPQQGFYDPSAGTYLRDDSSSGSGANGSSSQANNKFSGFDFDPFVQFK
ncbi:nuclear transcription factor Y subunit B-like [Mangifera indica]|uniref:nuclear transcription factor Y subunit B-like n=1 Tax=Mangifera indica TaxID=29780 RepID=UPI001CFB4E91|nr:nuclear transcription factor Y subunit B-like [Mangifera indica]